MKFMMLTMALLVSSAAYAAQTVPVTIHTSAGERKLFLEVAADDDARTTGLSKRDRMGKADGMLFVFPAAADYAFWMKDTHIPLDIIFIDPSRHVLSVHANAVPESLTPMWSGGKAGSVIELDGGRSRRDGIAVGDLVQYDLPKNIEIR